MTEGTGIASHLTDRIAPARVGARRRAVIVTLGTLAAITLADRWQRGFGATAAEQTRDLPGDELIPYPRLQATRAIGIGAPTAAVWPWLVQIGRDRGGFYSYDTLENLLGLEAHSASTIVPEWQDLAVGDSIGFAPGLGLRVRTVTPKACLVLFADGRLPGSRTDDAGPTFRFSWSFTLAEVGPADTRLAVRERYGFEGAAVSVAFWAAQWVSFVMTRGMLRGLKTRAEATHG
jgi:hypothetical protein